MCSKADDVRAAARVTSLVTAVATQRREQHLDAAHEIALTRFALAFGHDLHPFGCNLQRTHQCATNEYNLAKWQPAHEKFRDQLRIATRLANAMHKARNSWRASLADEMSDKGKRSATRHSA
ncbi:hypothetical protein [Xanthomonas campestris]|uniref:hypothetical protein n=1 Tax=Xanthomonas campestris TaxID=339 RepID=UPI0036DDD98C